MAVNYGNNVVTIGAYSLPIVDGTNGQYLATDGDGNVKWTAAGSGSQGIQGIQGIQGLTGLGSQGLTGSQGIQGLTGSGSQGIQGLIGSGSQGLTGSQGIQGIQGLIGSGSQGLTGSQGIQGLTGSQGIQGIQGLTGSQGIQGIQGLTGSQGIQGIQGLTGSQGIQGIQGLTGSQGIQGIQGLTGSQGIQGIQGLTGSQGIQGIQGLTGSQGIQGIQGPTSTANAHSSVYTATIAVLPNSPTYTAGSAGANGGSGVGAYLQATTNGYLVVDSYSYSVTPLNLRILVKNQSDAKQNGIYTVTSVGGPSSTWKLTRAVDYDQSVEGEVQAGDYVYVIAGNSLASTSWIEYIDGSYFDGSIIIGTDNINFTQTSAIGLTGAQGTTGAQGAGGTIAYWGSFYDTTNQSAANTTTAYVINIGETDPNSNGVSISSGNKILFSHAGTYNIQFSAQLINKANAIHNVNIWLRQGNGGGAASDINYTTGQVSVPGKQGSISGQIIASWNYVLKLNDNDYIQLIWQTENTGVSLETIPAGSSPTTPVSPSIIVTATQVTYTLQGIQGIQGITGSDGSQGIQGTQGTQGIQGLSVQGSTGSQGIQGLSVQGSTGSQGIQGLSVQGTTGSQGIQGSTGSQGIQGIQGLTGSQGIQGIQGLTGSQGIQGIQGLTGSQGIQGIQGLTGSQGIQGIQGLTGSQGIQGGNAVIADGSITTAKLDANIVIDCGSYSPVAPNAPTGLTAAAGLVGVATLSWTAPTLPGGASITDYSIQYSTNSGSSWTSWSHSASTTTSATITGLSGTATIFRVAGINSVGTGTYSSNSNSITPASSIITISRDNGSSTFTGSGTSASSYARATKIARNNVDGLDHYSFTVSSSGTFYFSLWFEDTTLNNSGYYIKVGATTKASGGTGGGYFGPFTGSFAVTAGNVITITSDYTTDNFGNLSFYGS